MHKVEICGICTSQLPKLTSKDVDVLLARIAEGDEAAKQEFLNGNLRLVLSIVGRFSHSHENSDDLFQVGCVGLMKALNNFDNSFGVKFSTYAVPMIIGEIKRFLRDRTSIKVSRSLRDTAYQALKAKEKLMATSITGEPTLLEIACELDADVKEIACALDAVSEPVSFYEPVYSDGEDSIMVLDQIADDKNNAEIWSETLSLKESLKKISKKEQQVLYLRYYVGKTQVEISDIVGISQAQVSRMEKGAIAKLKKVMQ